MRKSVPSFVLLLFCLLQVWIPTSSVQAQTPADAPSPIRLSGNLNLTAEGYGVSGTNPRYPSSIARAILQANVTLFDQIQLPFQLFLSTQQLALQQPFNQFGVSPRFFDGKLTLHAGYFATQFSEFTFGDARILGGGVETDLGNFRVAMLYGEARTALQADTSQNFFGQYRRQTFAAKIGAGEMNRFHIGFNILYAVDDSNSICALPNTPPPSENLAASVVFGFPITERIDVSGEIGASLFSNDLRSPKVEDTNLPVFTLRYSSQLDGAAVLTINTRPLDELTIGLNGRWIGPGYVSLGYVQLQNDLFDLTLSPSLKLLSGNLLLCGSFGLRFNNLRENRLAPSSRTIANLSATAQLSQTVRLDVQYSNYGIRTTPRNDTLRIENVAQSLVLSPRFQFTLFDAPSTVFASYSLQDVDDRSILGGTTNRNVTHTLLASWAQSFQLPLNLATTLLYNQANVGGNSISILSLTETVSYSFLDGKLSTSLTGGVNLINSNGSTTFTEFGIYEYAVQAFGMFESESALSASVQVEYKKLPPAPPADVRAIPTTEGVRITWGEVVQERLTGYKLYRYERGKTPTVLATLKPDEQTFLDTSAKKGTLYFYFVTSVAKTDESVPSEEVGLRP
jgi:hypothetical protein